MRRYLIPLAFLSIASCTVVGERYAEDGSVSAYQLKCGASNPWACESKAAELCPTGYRTVSKLWSIMEWTYEVKCTDKPAA